MSKQYLYRVSILNKKNSHPLEAISYYSGENQFDITNSKQYVSNTSSKVIWSNIIIPDKMSESEAFSNLPDYLKFRSQKKDIISNARNILWQNIYSRETREDAQFARIFEISIPGFLSQEDAINAELSFAKHLVDLGMIADCSIHSRDKSTNISLIDKMKLFGMDKDEMTEDKNEAYSSDYRGFLICTLRDYKEGMFVNKNREWNSKKQMEDLRKKWVHILSDLVDRADITEESKKDWEKKLSIYSEYEDIKKFKNLLKSNVGPIQPSI